MIYYCLFKTYFVQAIVIHKCYRQVIMFGVKWLLDTGDYSQML